MAIPVVTSLNPLEENLTFQKTPVSNKFYTSKLLNYVEPVEINGVQKTVFYTELSTNFNVGDRIFIVNGNYDSGDFIAKDKYSKYSDGYRVLGCDGCRLILDFDYTGDLPYLENEISNSIEVYHIRTQREFDYINSIKVNHSGISFTNFGLTIQPFATPGSISKFSGKLYNLGIPQVQTAVLFSGSIIYCPSQFLASNDPLNANSGVPGAGFYLRDDTSSTPRWVLITQLVLNKLIRVVNPNYSNIETKLYIRGENFTINSFEFLQNNIYTHSANKWVLNTKYKKPYVSKLNFRYGNFRGSHKDGIFGTFLKKNNWNGATWTSGALVNSNWNFGVMVSKSSPGEKLFFSSFNPKSQKLPTQTVDFSNNRGFGYNLIEDSIIINGDIKNGNFENCNLGIGLTVSSLDVYFGQTYSYGLNVSGLFKNCDIDGVTAEKSRFNKSFINNSYLLNSDIVNSQVVYSVGDKSTITDEEGINIISAELWSYNTSQTNIRGILKLYISDEDAQKIQNGDAFYLTKVNKNIFVNSLSSDQKIKLPVENKFILDIYSNIELSRNKIIVSVKNKNDNKIKSVVSFDNLNYQTNFSTNPNNYSSIDIDTTAFSFWEPTITAVGSSNTGPEYCLLPILPNQIELLFSNTFLSNADFKNGYLNNSNWLSGANINYIHHRILLLPNNSLNITSFTPDTINIALPLSTRMNQNINVPGEDLFEGDIVWLNSVDEVDGNIVKPIDGRYRVVGTNIINNIKEVILRSLDGLIFSSSASVEFKSVGAENVNYISIHKLRIDNSTINSGLFVNTSIKSSTLLNKEFDNKDRNIDIQNVNRLRLINIIFKNTQNKINSGYIFKSHFINDTWNKGIILNSIWNGGLFSDGIFNSGYWQNGRFLNGSFLNSKDTTFTTQSYDNTTQLYRNWLDGTFDGGEFYNSTWIKGIFNNGRFHNSDWYSGTWNNGILGSSTLRYFDTKMSYFSALPISGNVTNWNNGVVENAVVGGSSSIYWFGGKFNNGEFTSFGSNATNESIWYNGDFNNGKFNGLARWKNGKFFKGKFHSHYGMTYSSPTNSSTYSINYGWENGKFLGGEFGNGSTGTNSVWYTGEFNGGIFQGRLWFSGLFTKGDFFGSGSGSTIYDSSLSNSSEYNFANSFRNNYYGLWYNGDVSDNPKNIKTGERVTTELVRKVEEQKNENTVKFTNALWIDGTFSHKGATFENSVWLNGNFYDGTFDSSIFNAYVDRSFRGVLTASSFASTQSCVWHNGIFDSTLGTGSFYISDWKKGTFNNGYISGATWRQGTLNYGFADNILWIDGLWRNGNWNGAPFGYQDLGPTATYQFTNGRSKDIVLNVARNLGNKNYIYINNGFSASTTTSILTDPLITSLDQSTSSVNQDTIFIQYEYIPQRVNNSALPSASLAPPEFRDKSLWQYGTTFSISSTSFVTNTHVFTTGGQPIPDAPRGESNPESRRLYAVLNNNRNVFYTPETSYIIFLQVTVEEVSRVDVSIKVGNRDLLTISLDSDRQLVGNRIIYYPKQYDLNFVYTTPVGTLTPEQQQFYLFKGPGGTLRVLTLSIIERVFEYHPIYNNATFSAINFTNNRITLPSDPNFEVLAVSNDANIVSINMGNGLFKSGIWENGIWNNGFRSNTFDGEIDYYLFLDVVGLNGILPFADKGTYQLSEKTWLVTLQSIDSLNGLNVGDRVSIGNIVAIDVNEVRKLIKDYFTIQQIDLINNTVVVELVTNFPILRVEKDSENHPIYVSKNIWLTGAFLNGVFRGIWNNGLFKSYPKIGLISNSQWIEGKFDGGRFYGRKSQAQIVGTYSTGLIQRFTFIDNNRVTNKLFDSQTGAIELPKYQSWIDLNYGTVSKSTLNETSTNFRLDTYPPFTFSAAPIPSFLTYSIVSNNILRSFDNSLTASLPNVFLQGYVTDDVLESSSKFKDSQNTESLYRLGTKFKIYENLIPNDGNFTEPFSNNIGFGLDLTAFFNDGWTFSDFSTLYSTISSISNTPTTQSPNFEVTPQNPLQIDSNIKGLENKMRIKTTNLQESVIIQIWTLAYFIDIRFARIILNNENIETLKDRYYLSRVNLEKLEIKPAPIISNITGTIKFTKTNFNLIEDNNDYQEFKSTPNSRSLTKEQFFFNKSNLDLNIEVVSALLVPANAQPNANEGNIVDVVFNNISFYEVDMIPFFNYFGDESLIDSQINTPWSAVAPVIDYSDADFDFLGNVNLTIDSQTINNQVQYSVLSGGGISGNVTSTTPGSGPFVGSTNVFFESLGSNLSSS